MISREILNILLAYNTREEQDAWLAGFDYAEGIGKPASPSPPEHPVASSIDMNGYALEPIPAPPAKQEKLKHYGCRGLQADVLRNLFTGKAKLPELVAILSARYQEKDVRRTISRLVQAGFAAQSKDGMYTLTGDGFAEAGYFARNPTAKQHARNVKK